MSDESLEWSAEDLDDVEAQMDCGLPTSFLQDGDHCSGCFATFSEHDETQLSIAWQACVSTLNTLGYHAAIPSMDRHFERVFFLLVKDWQNRMDEVDLAFDSDAEYFPSEDGDDSDSDYSID